MLFRSTVFRHSHGFHLLQVVARIPQFSGAHTESTIFPYWFGQFFGTRTDSTFCQYLPGFKNVPLLTLILPFFCTGPDSFSVQVQTVFRYSPGFNNFPVVTLILPFFRTPSDSFSVFARIPPFASTQSD